MTEEYEEILELNFSNKDMSNKYCYTLCGDLDIE